MPNSARFEHLKNIRLQKVLRRERNEKVCIPPETRVAIATEMRETREFQNKMQAALQGSVHN